jgi:hypothetical protein
MDATTAIVPIVCSLGFSKLPLEIREQIYRMLLTTPYCTHINSTGQRLKFNIHTAILRINKRISAESTRVLQDENHFIILKINGPYLYLQDIPVFELLSEDRVANPLLRVKIYIGGGVLPLPMSVITCITTADGLQSILRAIWNLEKYGSGMSSIIDMKVSLGFSPKATARHEILSILVLKPWEIVNGIRALQLSNNIQTPMCEHLETHTLRGPSSNQVIETLNKYRSLAEDE